MTVHRSRTTERHASAPVGGELPDLLAVTSGGVDALVFVVGVGEHAAALRAAVCQVATPSVRGRIIVIPAREELAIAHEVGHVLGGGALPVTTGAARP